MNPGRNQAVVACPRVMRPGLGEVTCEADILVTVHGRGDEAWLDGYEAWLDGYEAPCGHTLTENEQGAVLDAATDDIDRRARERSGYDHYGRD